MKLNWQDKKYIMDKLKGEGYKGSYLEYFQKMEFGGEIDNAPRPKQMDGTTLGINYQNAHTTTVLNKANGGTFREPTYPQPIQLKESPNFMNRGGVIGDYNAMSNTVYINRGLKERYGQYKTGGSFNSFPIKAPLLSEVREYPWGGRYFAAEDNTPNGNYYVNGKQVPKYPGGGLTAKDIIGYYGQKLVTNINPNNWGVPDYSNNYNDFKGAYKAAPNKSEFLYNNVRYKKDVDADNRKDALSSNPNYWRKYKEYLYSTYNSSEVDKRYNDALDLHYRYGNPKINLLSDDDAKNGLYGTSLMPSGKEGRSNYMSGLNTMNIFYNKNGKYDAETLKDNYIQELLHARQVKDIGLEEFVNQYYRDRKRNKAFTSDMYDKTMYQDPNSIEYVHTEQGPALTARFDRDYDMEEKSSYINERSDILDDIADNMEEFKPYVNQDKIRSMQKALSEKGYKLPKSLKSDGTFDGIYGEETKNALEQYRSKQYFPESDETLSNSMSNKSYVPKTLLPIWNTFSTMKKNSVSPYDVYNAETHGNLFTKENADYINNVTNASNLKNSWPTSKQTLTESIKESENKSPLSPSSVGYFTREDFNDGKNPNSISPYDLYNVTNNGNLFNKENKEYVDFLTNKKYYFGGTAIINRKEKEYYNQPKKSI